MRNPPSSASSSAVQRGIGVDRVVLSTRKTKETVERCSKVGMKRGPWTPEEDELLSTYINREGHGRWRTLPKRAGLLRCGKSCRLRWMNYLRPSVKRGHIDPDEEDLILRLHRLLGNRWSLIAGRIPGRTDNEIKNYWNTHLSKKLIRQGIDPRTHKPLLSSSRDLNTITTAAADPHNSNTTDNQYVDSSEDRPSNLNLTTVSPVDLFQVPTHENKDAQECLGAMHLHNQSQAKGKGHRISKEEDDVGHIEGGHDNDDDDDEVKVYADDEAFSLFLSSVINYEELLKGVGGQQQQHDDEPAGNAMISSASRTTALHTFASGATGWVDAPMMHGFF